MRKNKKNGFTLLEVMLALGVITIGLMGVSSLVLQNIRVQDINKNYLVASMLAQEGLELVRNIRDSNFLQGYDWKSGNISLSNNDIVRGANVGESKEYTIDYNKNISDVTTGGMGNSKTQLYLNSGKYDHNNNGTLTPYRRLITVINQSNYYIEVHSLVQWSEHGQTHSYEAVTDLYNWW